MNEIERAIEIVSDYLDDIREFREATFEEVCAEEEVVRLIRELGEYREIGTVEELTRMKADYAEAICDWRQYRKISTPDECRAAVEKQRAKKPVFDYELYSARCPSCGKSICRLDAAHEINCHCQTCGQLIKSEKQND